MIEKIPDQIPVQTGEWRGTTFDIIPKETFGMACRKINELVDAVNGILDYAPLEMAIKAEPKTRSENVLTKSLRMDKEFAEAECVRLQAELDRTRKALDVAVDMLKLVYQGNGDPQDIMRYKDNRWTAVRRLCRQALEQITALEQKDVK